MERKRGRNGGGERKEACMYTTYLPQIHFYTVQFMSEAALSLLFTLLLPVDIRLSAQTILRTALYLPIQVPPLPTYLGRYTGIDAYVDVIHTRTCIMPPPPQSSHHTTYTPCIGSYIHTCPGYHFRLLIQALLAAWLL